LIIFFCQKMDKKRATGKMVIKPAAY